jgi:hypothetical protein
MNPLKPSRHNDDAMPVEVATAILTEPKAKITNRFRKQCKLAREKVYSSAVPLHRVVSECEENHKLHPLANPAKPTPPAVKLQSRTRSQVLKWLLRCIARRIATQDEYLKLTRTDTSKFTKKQLRDHAFMLLALEARARALDDARDTLEDEDARRVAICAAIASARKKHIDPQVRRRLAILRAVAAAQ